MQICDLCKKQREEISSPCWSAESTQDIMDRIIGEETELCDECLKNIKDLLMQAHDEGMDYKFMRFEGLMDRYLTKLQGKKELNNE